MVTQYEDFLKLFVQALAELGRAEIARMSAALEATDQEESPEPA